jgi:MYXO-CTERM domain-containing protein
LTLQAGGALDLAGATLGGESSGILSLTGGDLILENLTFQDLIGWDWANADVGTYELIDGAFSIDWGSTAYLDPGSAYDFGNGKQGYFTSGSLQAVIMSAPQSMIPEPHGALPAMVALAGLALTRRRQSLGPARR